MRSLKSDIILMVFSVLYLLQLKQATALSKNFPTNYRFIVGMIWQPLQNYIISKIQISAHAVLSQLFPCLYPTRAGGSASIGFPVLSVLSLICFPLVPHLEPAADAWGQLMFPCLPSAPSQLRFRLCLS